MRLYASPSVTTSDQLQCSKRPVRSPPGAASTAIRRRRPGACVCSATPTTPGCYPPTFFRLPSSGYTTLPPSPRPTPMKAGKSCAATSSFTDATRSGSPLTSITCVGNPPESWCGNRLAGPLSGEVDAPQGLGRRCPWVRRPRNEGPVPSHDQRRVRGGCNGYVASTTSVPVGSAQFCDVPPAGDNLRFQTATAAEHGRHDDHLGQDDGHPADPWSRAGCGSTLPGVSWGDPTPSGMCQVVPARRAGSTVK